MSIRSHRLECLLVALIVLLAAGTAARADALSDALARLAQLAPTQPEGYQELPLDAFTEAAASVDAATSSYGEPGWLLAPDRILDRVARLEDTRDAVDELLDGAFNLRGRLVPLAAGDRRQQVLGNYLGATSTLIELSGRVHAEQASTIYEAAVAFAGQPHLRAQLINLLDEKQSAAGAAEMSWALLDPPADSPNRAQPASPQVKAQLLKMIARSGRLDTLMVLSRFVASPGQTPELLISAAEAIRQVGLPQDPRPENAKSRRAPLITAARLHELLTAVQLPPGSRDLAARRDQLLRWLDERRERGITGNTYRVGAFDVQPGDWLLMRNPSPYNLFTDVSPGLFTHVGVVALERGSDGKQRMVLVDLPETGTTMPATNVEHYLARTLHYCFLRHEDPAVGAKMGQVAASLIGNPTEFDLNFQTERVAELKSQPLAGRKIKTYCAGLLLLCSQETGLPRREFFPLPEYPAGGKTVANLEQMGLRFGRDLVSPTGPLFAERMQLAGRREAMYDPGREVNEGIYDHFALNLREKQLVPTTDALKTLRLRVAEAAKDNPLLARALAAAANVSAEMDLVAAARAGAVVETLDEIAYGQTGQFRSALRAMGRGSLEQLAARGLSKEQLESIKTYRERHPDIWQQAMTGDLSEREIRIRLVDYYTRAGKQQIDERFFAAQ